MAGRMADQDTELFPLDHFTRVYDREEPRGYFRSLAPLGYRQPSVVAAYLAGVGDTIAAFRRTPRLRLLDFACGYGVLGTLLRHDVSLDELYDRFAVDEAGDPLVADQAYFAARRKADPPIEVGGLDIAGRAIAYARACGLIDRGFVEDLTVGEAGSDLAAFMGGCDLIVETGALYPAVYGCYERLLEAAGNARPWVLCGPRGDADTRALWALLEARGYRVEVCSRERRRYRRVLHDAERADAERIIRATGRDPEASLIEGWFVNDLVLARPEADAAALPVERLRF